MLEPAAETWTRMLAPMQAWLTKTSRYPPAPGVGIIATLLMARQQAGQLLGSQPSAPDTVLQHFSGGELKQLPATPTDPSDHLHSRSGGPMSLLLGDGLVTTGQGDLIASTLCPRLVSTL